MLTDVPHTIIIFGAGKSVTVTPFHSRNQMLVAYSLFMDHKEIIFPHLLSTVPHPSYILKNASCINKYINTITLLGEISKSSPQTNKLSDTIWFPANDHSSTNQTYATN